MPDVLTAAETESVRERLWAAAKKSEQLGVPTRQIGLDPNEHNVRVFYLLERDAIFRELIQHPTAIEFVTTLLTRFPDLQLHRQHRAARQQIDGAAFRPGHRRARAVVPSLEHQRHLVPERRRRGERRHALRAGQPPAALGLGAAAGRAGRSVPFKASAGSFVVMDGRLWHTSGANVSQSRERALLFGYYSRSFIRQQQNWNASLSPETIEALSPQLRAWLGMEARANVKLAQRLRIHPVATHTKLTS